MLTTYLHGFISKFIIVEDDLEEPGDKLYKHLITSALETKMNIIYWQFSFNLQRNISDKSKISQLHNFTQISTPIAITICLEATNSIDKDTILIIDSLAHMFYKLGGRETYKTLGKLNKHSELKQIITLLHSDLLHENDEVIQHCSTLASLHIKIERQFGEARRLSYMFRKGRGKVIRDIEEFCITGGKLITRPVAKLDMKTLLQEKSNIPSVNSLTTFNIELNEKDRQSRSQMDLPFLPKELQSAAKDKEVGEIHYVFDAGDDWDAEDPDDDLDI